MTDYRGAFRQTDASDAPCGYEANGLGRNEDKNELWKTFTCPSVASNTFAGGARTSASCRGALPSPNDGLGETDEGEAFREHDMIELQD